MLIELTHLAACFVSWLIICSFVSLLISIYTARKRQRNIVKGMNVHRKTMLLGSTLWQRLEQGTSSVEALKEVGKISLQLV